MWLACGFKKKGNVSAERGREADFKWSNLIGRYERLTDGINNCELCEDDDGLVGIVGIWRQVTVVAIVVFLFFLATTHTYARKDTYMKKRVNNTWER